MRRWRIGIIGGGPGGLMLAHQLQKRAHLPFDATIFEATERLGGKIRTNSFQSAAVLYEAGAAELYDYSVAGDDPLRELVSELGLSVKPMGGACGAACFGSPPASRSTWSCGFADGLCRASYGASLAPLDPWSVGAGGADLFLAARD
jgi:hypothetical protein